MVKHTPGRLGTARPGYARDRQSSVLPLSGWAGLGWAGRKLTDQEEHFDGNQGWSARINDIVRQTETIKYFIILFDNSTRWAVAGWHGGGGGDSEFRVN